MRFKPSPEDNTDPADGLRLGSGARRAPQIKPLTSGIGLGSVPEWLRDVLGSSLAQKMIDQTRMQRARFERGERGPAPPGSPEAEAGLNLAGNFNFTGSIGKAGKAALDMSQAARMARATEQGFDTIRRVYHGTPTGGFAEFSPGSKGQHTKHAADEVGYHFTDDPEFASNYSHAHDVEFYEQAEKFLGRVPGAMNLPEAPQVYPALLKGDRWLDVGKSKNITPETIKKAEKDYDGIRASLGGGANEYVVFNPSQIRSPNAAFDPAKRNSADLLASLGGIGLGAGLLGWDRE